jgi:hypothetical protein
LFAEDSFFDARDLVQVKYEMLRRVQSGSHSVTGVGKRLNKLKTECSQAARH